MPEHLRPRTRIALANPASTGRAATGHAATGQAPTLPAVALVAAAVVVSLLASACGSSAPVTYSAPVGISLDAKSSDVVAGQVQADKNISTENGNPYGAFVNAAEKALGHAPSRIVVTGATLTLSLSGSTLVTALDQVFAGTVRLSFEPNGSSNSYPVASVASPAGTGPVQMAVTFDSSSMTAADYSDLVGGAFKVALEGPAASGFGAGGATADMTGTFTFEAYP